jgi:hypothetical protein
MPWRKVFGSVSATLSFRPRSFAQSSRGSYELIALGALVASPITHHTVH